MNKLGILGIAVVILSITIVSISAEESLIPSWIKLVAEFWVSGDVSDSEFISSMEWMIENKFIQVSSPEDDDLRDKFNNQLRKNKFLENKIEELKADNEDLEKKLIRTIGTEYSKPTESSKPTEFNLPWEGSGPINIGGITVIINQFGYMSNSDYFGLDMTVEYTRGGNPVYLEVTNVSITDEKGFVIDADDSEFKKFASYYSENKKRGLVLFENTLKDFNQLDFEISLVEIDNYDYPYIFTFPYTFN